MASRFSMFVSAALALIAFVGYFAAIVRFTPYSIRFASFALDIGLLCSAVGVTSALIAVRQHRSNVRVCVGISIVLILLSAFALYATRAV
jgi:hypothetical protein